MVNGDGATTQIIFLHQFDDAGSDGMDGSAGGAALIDTGMEIASEFAVVHAHGTEGGCEATGDGRIKRLFPIADVGDGAFEIADGLLFAGRRLEGRDGRSDGDVFAMVMSVEDGDWDLIDGRALGIKKFEGVGTCLGEYGYGHEAHVFAIGLGEERDGFAVQTSAGGVGTGGYFDGLALNDFFGIGMIGLRGQRNGEQKREPTHVFRMPEGYLRKRAP